MCGAPFRSRLATCTLAQGLDPTRHETKRGLRGVCDPQGEAPAPGPCSPHAKVKQQADRLAIFEIRGAGVSAEIERRDGILVTCGTNGGSEYHRMT